jgi:hypothetical protein
MPGKQPKGDHRPDIVDLGKAVPAIINFRDNRLTEAQFRQRLVDEIVSDDLAIRLGTTAAYEADVRRQADSAVADAERRFPGDRNRIISEAYNAMTNSQPREPMFPYRDSPFLEGSDYAKKCTR